MALAVEGVFEGAVGREKPLHSSFLLSDRQVLIVLPAAEIIVPGRARILQSSTMRWQFVRDEGIRDKTLLFQFEPCLLVPP